MRVTDGHLLDGRVRYAQPEDGYRTGIEPVLLAAAVPARAGQRVLEAGTGAGAGLLCLTARVPGVQVFGVEIDAEMAGLARRNLAANGFAGEIDTADITDPAIARGAAFAHAFANPPWHDAGSTASPLDRRRRAKQAEAGMLDRWIDALSRRLSEGGTLSMILPAAQVAPALAAMDSAGLCDAAIQSLLPKRDRPAKLAIVQARSGPRRTASRPGLVLHAPDGRYTPEADRLLRGGDALPLLQCAA